MGRDYEVMDAAVEEAVEQVADRAVELVENGEATETDIGDCLSTLMVDFEDQVLRRVSRRTQ